MAGLTESSSSGKLLLEYATRTIPQEGLKMVMELAETKVWEGELPL